ncbi:alpha/beta hydrolase [Bacillus licheniformis]|jgi:non-heme chloroperoxidase|nr:alpha/beta hydrolase [Bacillus licheniformis]AAU41117.1 AB hydrolase superfamily protein YisY [Bacillus licheniformis DSM 13 = ATCC 14580]APJ27284.1 alpha/beta hydrolase [Bacillus sp. H15-1]ASV15683.1 alpha/beta hydrolase [Bacillus sp. 1s-1]MBC9088831.1 alpha/beta hydrolase [Bacillus sp. Y1]NBB45010.1 alpha/beta fold hydrolase [Bacillus sp. y1(2019)]NYV79592.1 alpha/beta hydrolase [Bacillus sp. Gen2]
MFSPRRHSPIYILGVSYGKDMIGGDGMGYFIEAEPSVNLYVEDINPQSGKAIVFLHGWPLSHLQFEYQFDDLSRKGYRCIGIDWRGFGRSDKPATGYNYNRLADDIRAVVEALQLNNFTLAGHSTGGAIALRYMSRYRGAGVSKLVLIDAAAPVGFTEETAAKLLQQASNDRPKMMREVTDTFFFQYITQPFSDCFFQLGLQAAGWSTKAVIEMLRDEKLYDDPEKVAAPALIIHGIQDKVIPFAQAKELSRKIRNSYLVPFQYSGHGPFWEERKMFNRILTQFIG